MKTRVQQGFSLLELLVSLSVLLVCMTGLATMMVENSKLNRSEQLQSQVQAEARNCLAMLVQKVRSAGWDPQSAGIATLVFDPDPGDDVEELEVFADLNADGDTDDLDEQVLVRHEGQQVLWRRDNDSDTPFEIVAANISNDADGDGATELMFEPDSLVDPTRLTVRITARSPTRDPVSGEFVVYTVASDVALRKEL